MLPHSYEIPAALLLILGGAVACFAGYRLFRVVLGIFGFMFGAWIASSMMGATNTAGMLIAAVLGGLAGSLILVFAYFVGIALLGAGLGAAVAHTAWSQFGAVDPPALAVMAFAILGAFGAMSVQRHVIMVGTAFVGAWTMMVGLLAMAGDQVAGRLASTNVWILYPLTPAPGARWVTYAWLALGVIGIAVQLGMTGQKRD